MKNKPFTPKTLILDADGVFTDGTFYYTEEGKVMKKYGPDDSDALSMLKQKMQIHVISGDKRGFSITQKRMKDMNLPIDNVSTFDRVSWIDEHYGLNETIYMGDGLYDALVFTKVAYSIAPANASDYTKGFADYVTSSKGGEGAVRDAVFHIYEKFLGKSFDVFSADFSTGSGAWSPEEKK